MESVLAAALGSLLFLAALNPISAMAQQQTTCRYVDNGITEPKLVCDGQDQTTTCRYVDNGVTEPKLVCDTMNYGRPPIPPPPAPTAPVSNSPQQGVDLGAFRRGAEQARDDQLQDSIRQRQMIELIEFNRQQQQSPQYQAAMQQSAQLVSDAMKAVLSRKSEAWWQDLERRNVRYKQKNGEHIFQFVHEHVLDKVLGWSMQNYYVKSCQKFLRKNSNIKGEDDEADDTFANHLMCESYFERLGRTRP